MKLSWKKEYKQLTCNFKLLDVEKIKEIYSIEDLYWQMMEQHVNFLIEI